MLTRYARYLSFVLGEQVLADLREDFVEQSLGASGQHRGAGRHRRPDDAHVSRHRRARLVGAVRRTGDDHRAGHDRLHHRRVHPGRRLGAGAAGDRGARALGGDPLVPAAGEGRLPARVRVVRRDQRERRRDGRGRRTVEALGLEQRRLDQIDADISESYNAERYTLGLRTVWFPAAEIGYLIPTVATLLLGGWLHSRGQASLGDVTAATLYVQALVDPVDRLLSWLDELQVGGASLARLLGVAAVPDDRIATGREPRRRAHRGQRGPVRLHGPRRPGGHRPPGLAG